MRTCFSNLKQLGTCVPKFLLTSILLPALLALTLTMGLLNCSGQNGLFTSGANGRLQLISIPISLEYKAPQASNLELTGGSDSGLELLATASSLLVEVSGCATGYTFGGSSGGTITSVVNLYNGDRNCIVKLHGFTLNGSAYNETNTGAVPFSNTDNGLTGGSPITGWAAGAVAKFAKTGSGAAGDVLYVFVNTQVSSPVSGASTVVYKFTDVTAGTTNTLSQSAVSTAVPLSATGKAAPNYAGSNGVTGGIAFARYLSTNASGSGNMSFTIACASPVTGTSPNFTCPNSDGSGDVQNNATYAGISYTMVPDAYNACVSSSPTTLSVANANTIFAGGVFSGQASTNVASTLSATSGGGAAGQIAAGGTDNWGNASITNGGFDTVSLPTGANPIYSGASASYANGYQYLNDILILRRRDANANTLSYLYYCINIAAITQS